ncbi:MAG: glycosyltransferase, partial [Holosporales bacterium]
MSKARFGVGAFFIVLSAVFFMPLQAQEQTSQASSPSKTLKIEDLITYQSHPDKKRLGHYEFLKRDFLMSVADANRVMSKLHTQAEQLIKSPQINPAPIPAIIHKIWLTNPNNPHDIPEKQLQGLIETCQQFPDYRHILWTNYPEALKPSLKKLGDLKIGIEVRSIEELRDLPGTKIGQAYLRQNIFANATDIIRLQILARDGGIYSDMGWTVFRLANVYDVFDAVMNTEYFDQGIVSHNVIATKANDPVIVTTLEKLQG